ncbi:methyltransferase domain-containing protein [Streptomyces sp. NPDC006368]|uniref:methyltransferase domain-containing protein n=1 Tax=Streptomyces sp. NPDC006368 TaxID=3156760 RepID=UPI0033BC4838
MGVNNEPLPVPDHRDEPSAGPEPSGEALFGTAAGEYARYRPGVPAGAVRLLAATLHGGPAPVLLDLGTGTGQVPRALLPVVPRMAHVDLVDVNHQMLAQAMAELEPLRGACTVSAYAGEAHTFAPRILGQRPDLVTCCRAFLYVDERRTIKDIAALAACSWRAAQTALAHAEIPARRIGAGAHSFLTRQWLAEQYTGRQRTLDDIAEEAGVSATTVLRRATDWGIPRRPRGTLGRPHP